MSGVKRRYGIFVRPAEDARPKTEASRNTPAGALLSPSLLTGPGKSVTSIRPRPQAKPAFPMSTGVADRCSRQPSFPFRSNSDNVPREADQESVKTRIHWLQFAGTVTA